MLILSVEMSEREAVSELLHAQMHINTYKYAVIDI